MVNNNDISYPLQFFPVLKQTIWGGSRIVPFRRLENGTDSNGFRYSALDNVGESWEVSGIPGNGSVVSNGRLQGWSLAGLVKEYKGRLLGEHNYDRFGNQFPLLVKFIDAAQDLSIQVHPNDALARKRHCANGKTEMWYVLDADKGAGLLLGFARQLTPQQYRARVENNTIVEVLNRYEVHSGDIFFLPAGLVHSIGGGTFLAEIQQTSDITYRIYDFNRKDKNGQLRELHTELAAEAIDYAAGENGKIGYPSPGAFSGNAWECAAEVVKCDCFSVSVFSLNNKTPEIRNSVLDYGHLDSFVILLCTKGSCRIEYPEGLSGNRADLEIQKGDVVLLPAVLATVSFRVGAFQNCEFLETHV